MKNIDIYYLINIIIPTMFLLFTLGNSVFTIGEFKEQANKVPRILILILLKLSFLTILQLHVYHYAFVNCVLKNFDFLSIFISIYMVLDAVITNKYLNIYRKYLNKKENFTTDNFDKFSKTKTQLIRKRNKFLLYVLNLYEPYLFLLFVINFFMYFSLFNYSLIIFFMLVLIVEFHFYNFLKTE